MDNREHDWPELPYPAWADTCAALHLHAQILGKYRLSHTPWANHSWHATLYPVPHGFTTGPVPDGGAHVTLDIDLHAQRLTATSASGARESFALGAMSVADFHRRVGEVVTAVGGRFDIHGAPNELPDPVPFADDRAPRPWDADAVARFHRATLSVASAFERFRTGFLGKVSPAHLFWGSFDLAVTRFSGRTAPPHPGGVPHLPDAVTREAYSHEVSSAGFWPGGGGVDEPMFYSYAYPVPERFGEVDVEPAEARWSAELGEFVLPYEAVRTADDPEAALLAFLQSTYAAAATTGNWDRAALECDLGVPGVPRPV